ncbi:hypothetical protein Z518_10176 [Neofusicoccum parvum]|nr:hypothetical protein Z518_10176 [Neofusicoccum parvum]
MHLIDLFFERIQPWLPLLHRPRFQKYYSEKLRDGTDCLDDLPIDEALLLSSLFALAARFSSLGSLANVPAARRGDRYAALSKKLYSDCRTCGLGTLAYLQGCILLAFYSYCSGLSQQGWILVGVCVRVAYDLGLSDLDGPDSQMPSRSWVQQEELRRAWWLVWELDTFGSSVKQRPYAVDRRRITVLLPVSDEAWFSETETPSSRLITRKMGFQQTRNSH